MTIASSSVPNDVGGFVYLPKMAAMVVLCNSLAPSNQYTTSLDSNNKQASDLETTITKLSSSISSLQVEVHSIRQEAVGVNSDRLNEFISWTERELNNLWGKLNSFNVESRLQQIEGQLRDQSGRNLDYRLSQMESRIQQIEWTLQGIQSSNSNDYRLQQIEWKLNDLQNQINSLRR